MKGRFPLQIVDFCCPILLVIMVLAGHPDYGGVQPPLEKGDIYKFNRAYNELLSGKLLFFARSYQKAQKVFRKCLKIFPAYADAYFYLSRISFRKQDFALALEQIRTAKRLYPATSVMRAVSRKEPAEVGSEIPVSFYYWHGDILMALGKYQEALNQYHLALKIDSDQGETFYRLARWHYEMGHYEKALMNLNIAAAVGLKAGEIDPGLKQEILKALAEPDQKKFPDIRPPRSTDPAGSRLYFGLKSGINRTSLIFNGGRGSGWNSRTGLRVGAFCTYDINNNISLQPEVHYVMKGGVFHDTFGGETFRQQVRIHYIEIPILLRLRITKTWTPDFLAGVYGAVRLGARAVTDYAGEMIKQNLGSEIQAMDFGLVIGAAKDFNLGPGTFILDFRYTCGVFNLKKSDLGGYRINNSAFSFMIGYGFSK